MFTVNIKGKRDPKNINFVKLEMVFYKRGYTRVTKVINIKGLYSDWDQKSQLFVGKIGAISICTMYTTCHNPDTLFRSDGVRFRLSNLDTVLPFHTALRLKVNV